MKNRYFIVFYFGRKKGVHLDFYGNDGVITGGNMIGYKIAKKTLMKNHGFETVSIMNVKEMTKQDYQDFLELDDEEME